MDIVRLVLPNEDVCDVVPLSSIGHIDNSLTDDGLRTLLKCEEGNLFAHLRLSFTEYAQHGLSGPAPLMNLLKVCLDKRYTGEELPRLLRATVPVTLAFALLGAAAKQPTTVRLDSLQMLVKAAVATALKFGVLKLKKKASATSEGEKVVSELLAIAGLLLGAVANTAKYLDEPVIAAQLDVSYLLSLASQAGVHPSVPAAAVIVLETACERSKAVRDVIQAQVISRASNPSALLTRETVVPLFETQSKALLLPLTLGLLQALNRIQLSAAVNLLRLTARVLTQCTKVFGLAERLMDSASDEDDSHSKMIKFTNKQITAVRASLPPAWVTLFGSALIEWLGAVPALLGADIFTPVSVKEVPKLVFRATQLIVCLPGAATHIGKLMEPLMQLVEQHNLWSDTESIQSLSAVFHYLSGLAEEEVFALPVAPILTQVLSQQAVPVAFKTTAIGACFRSFWSIVIASVSDSAALAMHIGQLRRELLSAVGTQLVDKVVEAYKIESKSTKADTLVGMIDFDETTQRVQLRRCVGALFSLFGTELMFQSIPSCRIPDIHEVEFLKCQDFMIDSGLWLIEALAEDGGCLGAADLSTWENSFRQGLIYCHEQTAKLSESPALAELYAQVSVVLKSALYCFLVRPICGADAYIGLFKSLLAGVQGGSTSINEVVMQSSLFRLAFKALAQHRRVRVLAETAYSILNACWQGLFDWGQRVLTEGSVRTSGELISAGRDLLTTVCGVIPDECVEQLIALILQNAQQRASDPTANEDNSIYCVYIELLAIVLEEKAVCLSPLLVEQLIEFSLTKMDDCHNVAERAVHIGACRAWAHVLIRLLESCSQAPAFTGKLLANFEKVLEAVYRWRAKTEVAMWKTRMQIWEAVLREMQRSIDQCPSPVSGVFANRDLVKQYLAQGPLIDACVKTASLTSVTRRRARRCLSKLAVLYERLQSSDELTRFLVLGVGLSECVLVQRGFVNAAEHVLEESAAICGDVRQELETVVAMAKPMCFNLEKKSTQSSRWGSRFSKSTRFTGRSTRRSIKSSFRPIRA